MVNSIIQIKRSTANATVTGLANGELAFTQASNTLYIGLPDGSGVIAIGGKYNFGTLTANQALVTNSTSGINRILAANVDVSVLNSNGSAGTLGYVLLSGGGTTNSYWATAAGLSVNNSAYLGGVIAASYVQNTDSRTLSGNLVFSGANTTFTGVAHTIGGTTTSISANVVVTGANIDATSTTLRVRDIIASGNLTISGTVTSVDSTSLIITDNVLSYV